MPELPKPNKQSLANLEKIAPAIRKRLQQITIEKIMEWNSPIGYSCTEAGNVTALNF